MKKKVVAMMMAAVMACSLMACGSTNDAADTAANSIRSVFHSLLSMVLWITAEKASYRDLQMQASWKAKT